MRRGESFTYAATMQYGGGGYGQRQPGAPKARIVMTEARKSYVNKWQTDLMGAPCANPGFCLYAACWCVPFRVQTDGRPSCSEIPPRAVPPG